MPESVEVKPNPIKSSQYMEAARAAGLKDVQIVVRTSGVKCSDPRFWSMRRLMLVT